MWTYILRRVGQLVPVLLGITLIAFALMYVVPGDPARVLIPQGADPDVLKELRAKWGLNDPLPVQYVTFLRRLVTFDLGDSWHSPGTSVSSIIWGAFKHTAVLASFGMLVAVVFGMAAGILSAVRPRGLLDHSSMVLALVGVSTPAFWLGMILIDIFAVKLDLLPIATSGAGWRFDEVILPALTIGLINMGSIARLTRSAMLEVMGQDYIRTARAKGLSGWAVVMTHAMRNALVPVITVIGANLSYLLSGTVLTETIFSWPGLGWEMLEAITGRDRPVVMAGVVWFAVVFVVANLIVDLSYGLIDPRIRYDRQQ